MKNTTYEEYIKYFKKKIEHEKNNEIERKLFIIDEQIDILLNKNKQDNPVY